MKLPSLSDVLEILAFALVAAFLAVVLAPVWALIPVAGYCLLASIELGRRR